MLIIIHNLSKFVKYFVLIIIHITIGLLNFDNYIYTNYT